MQFVMGILGLLILMAVAGSAGRGGMREARELAARFASVGNLVGKTSDEIVKVVGQPTSVSPTASGKLLQWQCTGYHVGIVFGRNGIFDHVACEHKTRAF